MVEILKVITIFALSFVIGFVFFGLLGGMALSIIFAIIWFDKVILNMFVILDNFGIELITMSSIMVGLIYGPVIGFFFGFLVIPLIEGLKPTLFKLPTDWPPFVPGIPHFTDGIIAVIASFLTGIPLFFVLMVCLIPKNFLFALNAKMIGKPFDVLFAVFSVFFNVFLVLHFNSFWLSLMA